MNVADIEQMPIPLAYTYSKLSEAVGVFITHEDDARRRLLAAELPLSQVTADSLPPPFDGQWTALWALLTAKGPCNDFTAFKCTVLDMRKKRAAMFIEEIWTMKAMLEPYVAGEGAKG